MRESRGPTLLLDAAKDGSRLSRSLSSGRAWRGPVGSAGMTIERVLQTSRSAGTGGSIDPIRPLEPIGDSLLVESPGRVCQHRVDLAGLRGEVGARYHLATVVSGDLVEEPLELADIAVHRLHEVAVAAILLADFLERALALHGVELAREHVALA